MKKRVLVAAVGIPFLLLVLIWAPDWATMLLTAALCGVGAHELMHAVSGEQGKRQLTGLSVMTASLLCLCIYAKHGQLAASWADLSVLPLEALLAMVFVFVLFFTAIRRYDHETAVPFADVTAALFAGLAFPLMLSCLLRLRLMQYGMVLVFMPLAISFGSDTLALFAGMFFGRHKLAPKVSPKKTVEGAVGGLLGGVFGLLVVKWIAYGITGTVFLTYPQAAVFGVLGSVVSQIGDLSFSVIKREFGVKDYGKLLPGHGGVLDRFDSVTFAAPFVWLILSIL